MHFKPADPELMLKAIEGYEDILAPEKATLDSFYRQFKCKRCGGNCRKEMVAGHVFDSSTMNPRCVLRCLACELLFDPHSGILLELGTIPHNSVVDPKT
jgi:hypothetical protein